MPYIQPEIREEINKEVQDLLDMLQPALGGDVDDGTINYVISTILNKFYNKQSYKTMQRAIGILACVQQEYYRKVMVPYENLKCEKNGEVFK
jgi:hypothetical protein